MWRGGAAGDDAIAALRGILEAEFGDLGFDRRVLEAWRENPDAGLDDLVERLASNRPAVSAAISRLGGRGLLA
jgi:hypothetical protein